MNNIATIALIGLLALSSASVIYAAKNESGSQESEQASQNSEDQSMQNPTQEPTKKPSYSMPSSTGVQNKTQVKTQNQGDESQLRVNTQTEKQLNTDDGQGASKTASQQGYMAKMNMNTVSQKIEALLTSKTLTGGAGEEIKTIVQQQTLAQDAIQAGLNKIDNRNALLKAFVGPDFTTLQTMHQQMEQNTIRIQQLTQLQTQLNNSADETMVAETIEALIQQNTNVTELVVNEEHTRSMFGWLFRYLAG